MNEGCLLMDLAVVRNTTGGISRGVDLIFLILRFVGLRPQLLEGAIQYVYCGFAKRTESETTFAKRRAYLWKFPNRFRGRWQYCSRSLQGCPAKVSVHVKMMCHINNNK